MDFQWDRQEKYGSLFEWSTPQFHAFCEQLATNKASELNFFLDWKKLPYETKNSSITHCEHGDWGQLRHLLTWVLQIAVYHYGSFPEGKETSSYWWFTHPYNHLERPATLFLLRWKKVICDIVRPSFWPEEPLCCSKWRNDETDIESDITCSIPTAHEFLEAQLGLREFLRPHLSTDEIEALFIP